MLREDFATKVCAVRDSGAMSEKDDIKRIHKHANLEKDLPICIGELPELMLELTRYQRGKMKRLEHSL